MTRRPFAGIRNRLRLLGLLSTVGICTDHLTKLAAAVVEPSPYVHNDSPGNAGSYGILALIALAIAVLPFRPLTVAAALLLGGGLSNGIDVYLWPGGVPDFIEMPGHEIWNVADLLLTAGGILFVVSLPAWLARRIWRTLVKVNRALETGADESSHDSSPEWWSHGRPL